MLDTLFYWILLSFIGLITAFIASAPIGPVNLWLANAILEKPQKSVHWHIFGVILADMIYIGLAIGLYFFWLNQKSFQLSQEWTILSGLVIMSLGIFNLLKNQQKISNKKLYLFHNQPIQDFLSGFLICGSNVMLLLFWLFMSSIFADYGLKINNLANWFILMLGILLGDLLWFYGFAYLVRKGIAKLSDNFIARLQTLIALSLIIFGLFTACK